MWGWRARIGIMIPSADHVQELDAFNIVPDGVSVHFTRMQQIQPSTIETIKEMANDLEKCTRLLKAVDPDVIVFGCTAGSFVGGPRYDKNMIRRIIKVSGKKATTTATSVIAALKALKLKRISVLAPYMHSGIEKLKIFLEGNGIEVLKIKGLGLNTDVKITRVSPEEIYAHAKGLNATEAEGLFISCTTFRATAVIGILERDLGKPVVAANQATLWNALRMTGIKDKISGYGELLTRL